jgi:hypothetical protein
MSLTTDPDVRQAFITGLQNLADYLARHPAVPVPQYGTEIHLSASSADDGGCVQVRQFARMLGVTADDSLDGNGHYEAVRSFGPVGYRIIAISDAAMARFRAADSYYGCVTPDTWT